jgi:hypothetical protein
MSGIFAKLFGKKNEKKPVKPKKKSGAKAAGPRKKKKRQSGHPLPDGIEEIMTSNGRVEFERLQKLAANHLALDFEHFMEVPVLVGCSVIQGDIAKQQGDGKTSATEMFTPADAQQTLLKESIRKGVFPLLKKAKQKGVDGLVYTIGRQAESDLTIADYAVSKLHGEIRLLDGQYWLRDCGSTNGTTVNQIKVEKEEHRIKDGDRVGFGRYEFDFVYPHTFYKRFRRMLPE